MTVDRVRFQDIVESQLPRYVREDFPLLPEFLKQYYISQEIQSGTLDLVQNLDQYVNLSEIFDLSNSTTLGADLSFTGKIIQTSFEGNFTVGFPDKNGLIQIDDEIIFYETKTDRNFEGCTRGFSGITSYISPSTPDELVFTTSVATEHKNGARIVNLKVLFLQQFLQKLKKQFTPGFSGRSLTNNLDQKNFLYGAESFYSAKGTDAATEVLFRALYGEDVEIIHPSRFLFRPSDADYKITEDFIVEAIDGDPLELKNLTLFQLESGANGSVTNVERINYDKGQYYQISVDSGYDRDINVRGTIYADFQVNPKTKLLNSVSYGSTILDVDSTLGFDDSGELVTTDIDGNDVILTYSGKNINQFFNVEGVTYEIDVKTDIRKNDYSYAYVGIGTEEQIRVRIAGALKDLEINEKTYSYNERDLINIKSLGRISKNQRSTGWITNVKTSMDVENVIPDDIDERIYSIFTFDTHYYYPGYRIVLTDAFGTKTNGKISRVISKRGFVVKFENALNLAAPTYVVENQLLKGDSDNFQEITEFTANVQNTYSDPSDNVLVVSNTIPNYFDTKTNPYNKTIVFSGSADGENIRLTNNTDHGFYTGDAVFYSPGITNEVTSSPDGIEVVTQNISKFTNVESLVYYVKRVDQETIKLARSRSDIFANKFISPLGDVTNNVFTYYDYYNKKLLPQSIIRQITDPVNRSDEYETVAGDYNGILVNGVEILNYKSQDKLFSGRIESIKVGSGGEDYDVVNPPEFHIDDNVQTGIAATGVVAVRGSLQKINIIDPGFDYIGTPTVRITGGNGTGAAAEVNLTTAYNVPQFNSEVDGSVTGGISTTNNTIGFSTYHRFRDYERVVYDSKKLQNVGGLSTGSFYYVSLVDASTVKLHKSYDDANLGINTISLTGYGKGIQSINSTGLKYILSDVVVTNPGQNYQNKKRRITGINTASNTITIKSHGYLNGEIIEYESIDDDVLGLSTTEDYFVTKVDNDNFKLSLVGTGITNQRYYLERQLYVDLLSEGTGNFNYQPISVTIEGVIGVNTLTDQDFRAVVQPIFRGEVDSVDLTEQGVGYGSSEILNFNRQPTISYKSGENAVLQPVISNGRISDVIIVSPGSGYNSVPTIEVEGGGNYAKLTVLIDNGQISEVKIISGGIGYVASETSLKVTASGRDCVSEAQIQEWNINLFERDFSKITSDDGFVSENIDDTQLQYSHIYAPRILRQTVSSLDSDGNRLYGSKDLNIARGVEIDNRRHSSIIGWAYDGNPIYGPYGYANGQKGTIKQLTSSYELRFDKPNRPSLSTFPGGFFVEDYEYTESGDLDKHNGRYCLTPDYPNGVYAYFATFDNIVDSDGPFTNYKRPYFPYLVGNSFKSQPNEFNYRKTSNQNQYNLENGNWFRNTKEYLINDDRSHYDFILNSDNFSPQGAEVVSTTASGIDYVGVVTGGRGYSVYDKASFANGPTGGSGAQAVVERISGKQIVDVSTASTSFDNVEFTPFGNPSSFIGFSSIPTKFEFGDLVSISGLNIRYDGFEDYYTVGVRSDNFVLTLGVGSATATGITTYFYVSGLLEYPYIRPNDILGIGTERVQVLNVDPVTQRIRVIREVDGTVGNAHTNSSVLYEDPRKFTFNATGIHTNRSFRINTELYFQPSESVGIGTTLGPGVGVTVSLSNPGVGATQLFLTPQGIYYKDHQLRLNDTVFYETHGGNSIEVWNGEATHPYTDLTAFGTLYVVPLTKDIIGIASNKVGLGTTGGYVGVNSNPGLFYFTDAGSGEYHSFETNYTEVLTGQVAKNIVTVSTASTHNLQLSDKVWLDVNPIDTVTVTVKYDDYNRRIIFNPQDFVAGDVNALRNTITFVNHNFRKGDKVLHTATSPSGGLANEGMYYVLPFSQDKIQLVENKFNLLQTVPEIVDITSASAGTLSKINPYTETRKNNKLKFDLSDESLSFVSNGERFSAFDMSLYSDLEYTTPFVSSGKANEFEVTKEGRAGIDATAHLTLLVSDYVPDNLWYKFNLINTQFITKIKSEILIDTDTISNNQINVVPSDYDGDHTIVGLGTTTFSFNLSRIPESLSYDKTNSTATYETNSRTATGSITRMLVQSRGAGYRSLPEITNVISVGGTDAILFAEGNDVGSITGTRFLSNNIGFDYPSDKTMKIVSNLPEIVEVETLASFRYIGITSNGRNYLVAPDLVVIDGYTNEPITDIDLEYSLGDQRVTILKNNTGIYPVTPRIVPVNNSNGIGINSIGFNTESKNVQVYFDVDFETLDDFPYTIGDRVFIENTSVGVGSTGIGYNSENYGYAYFTITNTDPNVGGSNGSITYDLTDYLGDNDVPGKFSTTLSKGRVIRVDDFPIFDPVVAKNDFFVGETVLSDGASGVVASWNDTLEIVKVSTKDDFKLGKLLIGKSSGTQAFIDKIDSFDSEIITGAGVTIVDGWQSNTGFLNDSLQKLPNNEYYQNFAYSISSKIPYDTWSDPVGSINHTAGFGKFADLQVVSIQDINQNIIEPIESNIEVAVDIVSESDIHCFYDFDNVTERTTSVDGVNVSDEIYFENRILTDHFESIGNRAIVIDDISDGFDSNERTDAFVEIGPYSQDRIFNRFFTYVKDQTFSERRESSIISAVQNGAQMFSNVYADMNTSTPLGVFDYIRKADGFYLRYTPFAGVFNNYDVSVNSIGIFNNITTGFGTSFLGIGSITGIQGEQSNISVGTTTNIVSFGTSYRSAKVRVVYEDDQQNFDAAEISMLHDGTDVVIVEYGNIKSNESPYYTSGVGTYNAYIDSGNVKLDLIPSVGVALTANSSIVVMSDNEVGVGSTSMDTALLRSVYTSIASSASPVAVEVASYEDPYQFAYYQVVTSNTTGSEYEYREVAILNSDTDEYFGDFGQIQTGGNIGTFGIEQSGPYVKLMFTPEANIATEVRVTAIETQSYTGDKDIDVIELENLQYDSRAAVYQATGLAAQTKFELKSNTFDIFTRYFNGSDSAVVGVGTNTVKIPNHYFVTGQNVTYETTGGRGVGTLYNIGIANTNVPGIGLTDKLPSDLYIVKVGEGAVQFAATAENALATPNPIVYEITSVGVGTYHILKSNDNDSNSKTLVSIDRKLQSPVSDTSVTSTLNESIVNETSFIVAGITSFYPYDIIRIDNEYMTITASYLDSGQPTMDVVRAQLGSDLVSHSSGTQITKIGGQYNIVENTINFVASPYGNVPLSTTTEGPNEADWTGITTHSTFQGRAFLRTAPVGSSTETYDHNAVFDDLSPQFTGLTSEFTLKSQGNDVPGISTYNAAILINGIFQKPDGPDISRIDNEPNYDLLGSAGITTIQFLGDPGDYVNGDVNTGSYPRGGIIQEVGSTPGYGYQPLVAAGGTAVVSGLGTISSIAIGNSGSGYRPGVQTVVNVGVQTYSDGVPNIEFIGTAAISGGHIVSVAITNPGAGYTTTDVPQVVFDKPLSYSNIPLIYSGTSGIGTDALVDITVGLGSSVIDFTLKNTGSGYGYGDTLTVAIGGTVGIPTNTNLTFSEFQLSVNRVYEDLFNGWFFGELEAFDSFEDDFDGVSKTFNLKINGEGVAVMTRKGSVIDTTLNLLVFVNNILQEPHQAYEMQGGSVIRFSEAPKAGDTCTVVFYKGTPEIDVIFRDVLETIKEGDVLDIYNDPEEGQGRGLDQNPRVVTGINTVDSVRTNPYRNPGVTTDTTLQRPIAWCKQTVDKIINNQVVGKDRPHYEPNIYPFSYLIENVGITTQIAYVDSVKPLFDAPNEQEDNRTVWQNKVEFVSQADYEVGLATAVVDDFGRISSIVVTNPGAGYTYNPQVSIAPPADGTRAVAESNTFNGKVTGFNLIEIGAGYTNTNPPLVLIETPNYGNEIINVDSYEGDYGIVVGFGTTTTGDNTQFIFDFFIPTDSFLRDDDYNSPTITVSGISTGDFFTIFDSDATHSKGTIVSLQNDDTTRIGVSTQFLDNIYQVASTQTLDVNVIGVGVTEVRRVFTNIVGYSTESFSSTLITFDSTVYTFDDQSYEVFTGGIGSAFYFANFSWGKLNFDGRNNAQAFDAETLGGYSGLNTSTYVRRYNPLRYKNYYSS